MGFLDPKQVQTNPSSAKRLNEHSFCQTVTTLHITSLTMDKDIKFDHCVLAIVSKFIIIDISDFTGKPFKVYST